VLKTILPALNHLCCGFQCTGGADLMAGQPGGNDHYYEFVLQPELRWTDAKAAEARTFSGAHGYLATVTSAGQSNLMASHWPERGGACKFAVSLAPREGRNFSGREAKLIGVSYGV